MGNRDIFSFMTSSKKSSSIIFTLNTNVYMPHDKELNCILFKPSSKQISDFPQAVTTSQDGRFKIWALSENEKDHKESWNYEFMGYYKDDAAGSASFSEDGSILAVVFGQVATLWNVEKLTMKERLFAKRNIQQLLFGCHSGFKYLLGHDGSSITAWDCLTLTVSWIVHAEVQLLVRDNISGNIAAFCKDQNVKIFQPESPQPLDFIEKVSDSPIVSALFVPSDEKGISGCFHENSLLFFLDEAQNLFTLSQEKEDEDSTVAPQKKTVMENLKETPFGVQLAAQTVSSVKKPQLEQLVVSKDIEEINIITNPTWQNMSALFHALVPKLLVPRKSDQEEESNLNTSNRVLTEQSKNCEKFILEDGDWRTGAFCNIEAKILDLSSLTQRVVFTE